MFYTNSTISLDDSPFKLFKTVEVQSIYEFISEYRFSELFSEDTPMRERELYNIYLKADSTSHNYSRVSYSLLDYMGNLRGLYSIIFVCVYYVVRWGVIEKKFDAALVKDTYQE